MQFNRVRPHRLLAAAALAVALAGPVHLAPAQDADPNIVPNPIVTLAYNGGTLASFIEALKEAGAPNPITIVLRGDAEFIEVPPMDLTQVSVDAALALAVPHDGRRVARDPDGGQTETMIILERVSDMGSTPVYLVEKTVTELAMPFSNSRQSAQQSPPQIEVFALERVMGGSSLTVTNIIAAVEAALDLDSSAAGPAEVRFHDETSLLIVRGSREQIEVVHGVLNNLDMTARDRQVNRSQIKGQLRDMEQRVVRGRAILRETEADMTIAQARHDLTAEKVGSGLISELELHEANADLIKAEARLEVAHFELALDEERLAEITARYDAAGATKTEKSYAIPGSQAELNTAIEILGAVTTITDSMTIIASVQKGHDGSEIVIAATNAGHKAVEAILGRLGTR